MNAEEILRYVLTPHEPEAGWSTAPPEWMTRNRAAVDNLDPEALDAVRDESGIFWLNFHEMIAAAIAIYVRASKLDRVHERCEELERRCGLLAQRDANLWQSAAVALGEAIRERQRADDLARILDSAIWETEGEEQ